MALFTDAVISTLDQLATQDSSVLDVANTEGIDVSAKIAAAQEELSIELLSALSRSAFSPKTPSAWWPGIVPSPSALRLSNIVVTPALRLWHTFHALELIYRDAYGNQLNDRYLGKVNSYKDLAKWASVMLLQTGVGVVADPIAVASSPEVDIVTGAQPASPYFVQIAWLNAGGEEGMAGPVHSVNAPDQHSLQVKAIGPPANAAAWNVFVGTSIDVICLQNSQPVAVDQIWSMPSSGLVSGRVPGVGQEPQYFTQLPRFLQRG